MTWRIQAAVAMLACVLACFGPVLAADIDPEPVKFDIRRFVLDGNTLLPAASVERVLAPHHGQNGDFAAIQRALEALEGAYRDIGHGVVQVTLPEQNITQGEIRVVVIEPRIGQVTIDNTGCGNSGDWRTGMSYQHANVFDHDHVLTAQYVTSPSHSRDLRIFGVGYRTPGGSDASDSDFKASRTDAKAAYRLYRYNFNYAFYDWGTLSRRSPQPADSLGETIAAAGLA